MSSDDPHVLLVDDDEACTRAIIRALERRKVSFECHAARDAYSALDIAKKYKPQVAIVDLSLDPSTGPQGGFDLINALQECDPTIRILVLTGHGAEEYGIKALQFGAASFLQKPAQTDHLCALISDGISFSSLKRKYHKLIQSRDHLSALTGLTSRSPAMLEVLEAISYAASNNQPVLILGETGTGKGVVAQAIHRLSPRVSAPFIRVQPSFGSQDLISSEVFGHVKGSFTGAAENRRGLLEEAHNGTFFIDEVAELPQETQVLLLNVLQERVFRRLGSNRELSSDFRLIAATNCPLEQLTETGKLRQDFYHRIAHFSITVPPLRERKEDIEELSYEFLRAISNREGIPVQGLSERALARLVSYEWPGNVRELQAVVEGGAYRASFHERRFVEGEDLKINKSTFTEEDSELSFRERVHRFELELVHNALVENDDNQTKAAESLQLDRSSFRRILEREQ